MRFSLAVLGIAAALGAVGCPHEDPEPPKHDESYIVGGELTRSFAATGVLLLYGQPSCTATLVAPDKVLTAAHCVVDGSSGGLSFALGIDFSAAPPERKSLISGVAVHPQYQTTGTRPLAYDLAVLSLASRIETVKPVMVAMGSAAPQVGASVTLVGYGSEADGRSGAGIRRLARVTVAGLSAQTLDYNFAGAGACKGDSGGPMFASVGGRWFEVGVTSWGAVPCTGEGHYQRLDVAADWLKAQGVPEAGELTQSCASDSTCNGACEEDQDCWSLMCPSGRCTAPEGKCTANGTCEPECGTSDPDCGGAVDNCERYGLYRNGVCDQYCPKPDPECAYAPAAGFCCDQWLNRRCYLVSPIPIGATCFCPGQGYGRAC